MMIKSEWTSLWQIECRHKFNELIENGMTRERAEEVAVEYADDADKREKEGLISEAVGRDVTHSGDAIALWNYRVIRDGDYGGLEIHEVYYDVAGAIVLWSKSPLTPFGLEAEELREDIKLMLEALDKPILDEKDLPK
jgi:hypothetical protein